MGNNQPREITINVRERRPRFTANLLTYPLSPWHIISEPIKSLFPDSQTLEQQISSRMVKISPIPP